MGQDGSLDFIECSAFPYLGPGTILCILWGGWLSSVSCTIPTSGVEIFIFAFFLSFRPGKGRFYRLGGQKAGRGAYVKIDGVGRELYIDKWVILHASSCQVYCVSGYF